MDIRQLTYFVAVCKFQNLSHAANYCNTAASALSHHIGSLETELGTKLFVRKSRGMEPTAAGLRLLEHAHHILATVDAATAEIRHEQTEVSGTIDIGMPLPVINVIGAALMRRVIEDFPKVQLVIHEGLSGVTYEATQRGVTEAALAFNPPFDTQMVRTPILEEEIFCIGDPKIIGHSDDPISLKELETLPVALLNGVLSRALVDRPAEIARLEPHIAIRLASVNAILCAIKDGLACTLTTKVLVSEELQRGDLVARKIANTPPLTRTLYLVSARETRPTFLRETILELVTELIHNAVMSGVWDGAKVVDPKLQQTQ